MKMHNINSHQQVNVWSNPCYRLSEYFATAVSIPLLLAPALTPAGEKALWCLGELR